MESVSAGKRVDVAEARGKDQRERKGEQRRKTKSTDWTLKEGDRNRFPGANVYNQEKSTWMSLYIA